MTESVSLTALELNDSLYPETVEDVLAGIDLDAKTEKEIDEILILAEQIEREKVVPKLECFREPARYKLASGGRGSGKSISIGSLLCQAAQNRPLKILCTREVQLSLEESVYAVIVETLKRLQYTGWTITKEAIYHQNGSRFIFRGLKDLRAANAVKSMEGIDICWIEEAHSVSEESLKVLVPTIRKEGSEIWASWNPETESDPIMAYTQKPDAMVVTVNWNDNPWFPEVLRKEKDDDFQNRPEEAVHIWDGLPRSRGAKCAISLKSVHDAINRRVPAEGAEEMGVDVARFGNDTTQIFRRHGLKIISHAELKGFDTVDVAGKVWEMADQRRDIVIKVDAGYNPGVIDLLRSWGANVAEINFGGAATDKERFATIADEMWFTLPIDELEMPDDPRLKLELTTRQFKYDSAGRKRIESKDDYKKRNSGISPDKADGFILCFFSGKNTAFDEGTRNALKARRARR